MIAAGPDGLTLTTEGVVLRTERRDDELRLLIARRGTKDVSVRVPWPDPRPVDLGDGSEVILTHTLRWHEVAGTVRESLLVKELDGDVLLAILEGAEEAQRLGTSPVPTIVERVVYTTTGRDRRACYRHVEHHAASFDGLFELRPGETVALDGFLVTLLDAAVTGADDACREGHADRLAWVLVRGVEPPPEASGD